MTDNQKLIEEAAKALRADRWGTDEGWDREKGRRYLELARTAFAVFEKANLTDARGKYTDAQVLSMIGLALEEGIEGVNRRDLNDLLLKMIAEHWGTADEDASPDEALAAFAQLEPYIPDHLRVAAVTEQGENRSGGRMSGMDGYVLFAGLGLVLALSGVITSVAIVKARPRPHPRRATRSERAKNQSDVEEWTGRTKGVNHVRRMRGEE